MLKAMSEMVPPLVFGENDSPSARQLHVPNNLMDMASSAIRLYNIMPPRHHTKKRHKHCLREQMRLRRGKDDKPDCSGPGGLARGRATYVARVHAMRRRAPTHALRPSTRPRDHPTARLPPAPPARATDNQTAGPQNRPTAQPTARTRARLTARPSDRTRPTDRPTDCQTEHATNRDYT